MSVMIRHLAAASMIFGLHATVMMGCGEGSFDDDGGVESDELTEELTSVRRAWSSGVFTGDLGIRASWQGSADLDIYVKNPLGETISFRATRDSRGGVLLKNSCQSSQCNGQTSEEVGWLNSAPTGTYEVWVQRDNSRVAEDVMIEVSRAGALEQTFEVVDLGGDRGARSSTFSLDVQELPVESTFNGELGMQLSWSGSADLDLYITTPSGERIFFGNRNDSLGGKLTKNVCLLSQCKHTASEEVVWDDLSPRGDFQITVVNYNGHTARDVKLRVHNRRQIIESLDVSVPARRRGSVELPNVSFDTMPLNPDGLDVTSHQNEEWIRGQDTRFELDVNDTAIERVTFSVNGRDAGSADASDSMTFEHRFAQLGEQSVSLAGFDGDGMMVSLKQLKIVVTDTQGGLPRRGRGLARDVSTALLAKRIHALPGIELFNQLFDSRYRTDERNGVFADANNNMLDAGNNVRAQTSCYGNAPCRTSTLDGEMLQAMLLIHQRHGYDFRVSTIIGGSHSRSSRHYDGIAFDINRINGGRLSTNTRTLNRQITNLCREYGATEILSPPDRGHSSHIHCAWPRR